MIKSLFKILFGMFQKDDFFIPERAQNEYRKSYTNKQYELVVTPYYTGEECFGFTLGEVFENGKKITDVKRNYPSFWHEWILNHPDGHDYLLCGEDYMGVTVIQLDTGKRKYYYTKYCWSMATASLDKTMVAVEGCFWGGSYTIRLYDFSRPMKSLKFYDFDPHGELAKKFFNWNDDNSCVVGIEVRKSDGKPVCELTSVEHESLLDLLNDDESNYADIFDYKKDTIVWNNNEVKK